MKHAIITFGFALSIASVGAAQTPLDRAKAGLPADAARGLDQIVASARTRGLPADPLVDKALEGVSKRAPANLILDAVRRRLDLLARADADLRPYGTPTPADVTATADALQRGLSDEQVKRVRAETRAGEPVATALHVLADLLERGVPVDQAFKMLSSWRERGGGNAPVTPPGQLKKAQPKAPQGKVGPPVPPGSGPPPGKGKKQ
jgi:hypothetical protein